MARSEEKTEFEMKALDLLKDISERLLSIEQVVLGFEDRLRREDADR